MCARYSSSTQAHTSHQGACESDQLGDADHIHAEGRRAQLAVLGELALLLSGGAEVRASQTHSCTQHSHGAGNLIKNP